MQQKSSEALKNMREQTEDLIKRDYKTVEEFCWENDVSKATVSNFLRGKKDFQISTLIKIADALGKELIIKLK